MFRVCTLLSTATLAVAIIVVAAPSGRAASSAKSATAAAPATAGKSSTAAKPVPKPAASDTLGPGAAELAGFAFLAGRWTGELNSGPIQMDIAIDGAENTPGRPMRFTIRVVPRPGTMGMGVDGDYSSFITWSSSARALRAVVADTEGRGVELLGGKTPGANEWMFNSTDSGAPFPFRVRIAPLSAEEVVVSYLGGRFMNYDITFHRVAG